MNKNVIYVLTVCESVLKIEKYTEKFSDAESFYLEENQLYFNAVLKLLSVIGEDIGKIDQKYLNNFPEIPWRLIKGARNVLVHDYRKVDINIAFSIVKDELPPLKITIFKILNILKGDFENEVWLEIIKSPFYKFTCDYLDNTNFRD